MSVPPAKTASLGMVIFIILMVTLAGVGQLFIKHGVNTFQTTGAPTRMGDNLLVPDRAIERIDGRATVDVVGTGGSVEARNVALGGTYSEGTVISSGLDGSEKIIVRGKFPSDLFGFVRLVFYWPVLVGLIIYFFFGVAWLKILADVPVSFAFPFLAISYVVIILGSAILLNEDINPLKIVAIALIIAGVICLSRSDTTEHSGVPAPGD